MLKRNTLHLEALEVQQPWRGSFGWAVRSFDQGADFGSAAGAFGPSHLTRRFVARLEIALVRLN